MTQSEELLQFNTALSRHSSKRLASSDTFFTDSLNWDQVHSEIHFQSGKINVCETADPATGGKSDVFTKSSAGQTQCLWALHIQNAVGGIIKFAIVDASSCHQALGTANTWL
jgi:hypothetical protein